MTNLLTMKTDTCDNNKQNNKYIKIGDEKL